MLIACELDENAIKASGTFSIDFKMDFWNSSCSTYHTNVIKSSP